MPFGDKSDLCDTHLLMFYGETACIYRHKPDCPSCASEQLIREKQENLYLLRAKSALPHLFLKYPGLADDLAGVHFRDGQ